MDAGDGEQARQNPADDLDEGDISWMFDEDDGFLEEALAAPEDEDDDPFYFVRSQKTGPRSDVYQAARVGDLDRIKHLVEEDGVDVNTRDRWDSVPLYYACLAGHSEVVEYLLEAGAVCNEYTFDGDRCHYAALTPVIRALLRQYEQRPPPLAPLAADLRTLTPLCDDLEAPASTSRREEAPWCDFAFVVAGERITLHRAVLAARSPFFCRMLLSDWSPKGSDAGAYRVVQLKSAELSAAALKAVLAFLYTERLDVAIEDVEAVLRVARKCKLRAVVRAITEEQRTLKYYFKSTRRDEGPRRFVLQPGAVPEEYRLAAQLGQLRTMSMKLEAAQYMQPARDFADVLLRTKDQLFRCHCCILSARSDYLRALLVRSESLQKTPEAPKENCQQGETLPVVSVSDVSAAVLATVLEYVYSDALETLAPEFYTEDGAEQIFDAADRYLLFPMKRKAAEAIIREWEVRAPRLEPMCRMLLLAERYSVTLLRDRCLHALAARFEALVEERAPRHEREVFEAFVAAVAPRDAEDIFDGSHVLGASRGDIVGSGIGGLGIGTILQDLREAFLEDYGGIGEERDRSGDWFDARLQEVATCAFERDVDG
ncbi:Ankyrin repeat and BTB/POZ domain-containing protein 1 [Coccomyxa sp. Obi]|nr:Ankyrin repeat and BTB/POZ domain-containing protein 1 [Coccomyxa sp. Obi]